MGQTVPILVLYNKYFRKETITLIAEHLTLLKLYNKYFRKETITI